MFTRQVKVQIGKRTYIIETSKSECRLWREINNLSIQPFDRKWTDLIRQRWISKCLFPRRHIVYKQNNVYSIIGKVE